MTTSFIDYDDFHAQCAAANAYADNASTTITLDLPGIREFIQEHPGCDWEDACDWFEQVSGQTVPQSQWSTIEEVWEEESKNWEPTDDEVMGSFGTKWHDGL